MAESNSEIDSLRTAIAELGLACSEDQILQLDCYRRELLEWNKKINLTRHLTIEQFVDRDVRDTMMLNQFLEPRSRILDVGTGGGVPGILLSILRPDLQISLSESVAKRANVLEKIVARVGVSSRTIHARAEDILAAESFDVLTVRAVARLQKVLTWFSPHWSAIGQLLLVKGPAWAGERLEAREAGLLKDLELRRLARYSPANSGAECVVLRVRHPSSQTPRQCPTD